MASSVTTGEGEGEGVGVEGGETISSLASFKTLLYCCLITQFYRKFYMYFTLVSFLSVCGWFASEV